MNLTSLAPDRAPKGKKKQTQWTIQKPFPVDNPSPLYGRKKEKNSLWSPLYRRENLPNDSPSPLYRRKEKRKKKKNFSVDSPSSLYRRKKPSQWTVRHPCMEEKKKNKEKTKQNFQLNICTEEKDFPSTEQINPPQVDGSNLSQWTVCLPYT